MLNLSFPRLRIFLVVAETESISGAAERLMVSQPAVSAAMSALQSDVGVALIARDGRRIRLTEAGQRLAVYGRQVFALLGDALDDVRAVGLNVTPRVRVGAVTTVAENLLPPILGEIRQADPEIELELDVSTRQRIWGKLAAWEVQVVVGGRPPLDERFRSVATRPNAIVVVAPPQHANITIEQLSAQTWLLREQGTGTRALSHQFFEELGIEPGHQVTIGSNGAIRESVRAGLGVSLVSRDSVRGALGAGTLVEVPTPVTPLERQWHVVVNDNHPLPPIAARFVQALAERWTQK